ncbi:TetR family transcriptional regulator [Sphingopyxis sp. BSN-002]|uniref:TetR/AcrR family transcriptional regulator n=1 Tax=Sphingopyxis sp. BSN-002 TaxID=2911495 RepID=UPI001EDA0166|nr:TetR family transcriptional regulator [Sphingopyxis sp. BSN-002]UKK85159.1 TetR family transcriptional regulator [Sphingopyxis sp. BSN-002]
MVTVKADRKKPLASAAQAARRALLLDEAAQEFRARGVAGADLIAIAARVGLSRPSLYNYCSDRTDLARQCYLHLLEPLVRDLDRAAGSGGSGLDAVLQFMAASQERDHSHAIIAAELEALPEGGRREISARQHQAFGLLADLVARGITDGSVRRCDPAIAARTIWGLIAWAPLGDMWARGAEPEAGRLTAELGAIVESGVATGPAPASPEAAGIEGWASLAPAPAADRAGEIVTTASALFNARGVEGVSLDDIAAELGATKGLVYHHFASKAELVAACLERAFDLYAILLDRAETFATGVERSRSGLALNVQAQLDPAGPMSLSAAAYHKLSPAQQERYSAKTTDLLDRSIAMMVLGNRDATLRPFEAEPTALASAGTFNFVARWLPRNCAMSHRAIAFEVSNLFLHGLRAS